MSSPCELRLYVENKNSANQVASDAIEEIHRLEKNTLVIVKIVSRLKLIKAQDMLVALRLMLKPHYCLIMHKWL